MGVVPTERCGVWFSRNRIIGVAPWDSLSPTVGAAFFVLFREVLTSFTEHWLLYFGLLFMGFILFSPDGILGVLRRLFSLLRPEVAELAAMAGRLVPAPGSDGVVLTGRASPYFEITLHLTAAWVWEGRFGRFAGSNRGPDLPS